MASVDVPVALLGYGTVGSAVNRLLNEQADDIERATGHRLRVVKALVRNLDKERAWEPGEGVLTTDIADVVGDPSIAVVAEVMGGVDPAGEYVLECLRRGKHVVSANKQLVARRGAELFAAATDAGVQLRFEASVCAAIPVIKVLRESLVVTNVHRVLGIVNGTTNFVLTEMEAGKSYDEALAEAQARLRRGRSDRRRLRRGCGGEDGDPRHRRVQLALRARRRRRRRDRQDRPARHRRRARARDGDPPDRRRARLSTQQVDVRVRADVRRQASPAGCRRGAFNAVMLQGDAIREITLEGPGARRHRDGLRRDRRHGERDRHDGHRLSPERPCLAHAAAAGARRAPLAVLLPPLGRRPARRARAHVAEALAERDVSIARILQHANGNGAAIHVVTHEAREGIAERRARRDLGARRGA